MTLLYWIAGGVVGFLLWGILEWRYYRGGATEDEITRHRLRDHHDFHGDT